jgi:hypothetical protein
MTTSDVIAICAAIIALAASAGTFWQGYIARKHNMLSVRPHLSFEAMKHPSHPINYLLKNTGMGSAIIKKFLLVVDGIEYDAKHTDDVKNVLNRLGLNIEGRSWMFAFPDVDSAISSDASLQILEFTGSAGDSSFHQMLINVLPRLCFKIEYECMYGNKFSALFFG